MQLVLASNSPRRKELIAIAGWNFAVAPAEIDEALAPGEDPAAYVRRLAVEKARKVAAGQDPGAVIVAADTTVALGPEIFAKPEGAAEAEAMLRRLRGRPHQVLTALAVLRQMPELFLTGLVVSTVVMRPYSDAEIRAYVASGDPFDKAGGYAIQNQDFHPVERLEGCYTNVVGLPLCRLAALLDQASLPLKAGLPYPCLYQQQAACSFIPAGCLPELVE